MALTRSLITFERRARRTTTLFSARVRLLLLCGLAFARSPASGAPGELDTTFGTGGIVITDFGSRARCYGLAVQRDGKIVVAGWASNGSNRDFALARYTANGALDPSFGTNGKVTTAIGNSDELAFDVVVQSDGKIVAAGWSSNGSNRDFALVRYTAGGALDPSFGTSGMVTTPIGSRDDTVQSVALQGDGKIVVAGISDNGSNPDFALVRYTDSGALDPSFGTGGVVTTDFGGRFDFVNSLALQDDGKIVVAGGSQAGAPADFALARYTDSGALDPSFGTAGMVITPIGSGQDLGQSVVVESDGKIIVVGSSDNGSDFDIALVRYTANGALDPSFGTGGKVTTPIGNSGDLGSSLALLRDGKIVVAGWSTVGANFDIALLRYSDSGVLDPSFGTGGKVTTPVGNGNAYALSVAVQSDGKIVVAGWSEEGSSSVIALVRYEGDPVTNPPVTLRIAQPDASTFSITLTGSPNSTNQIEFADKLQSPTSTAWRALGAVKLDGQGIGTFQDNSRADMRFYRAVYP